MDITFPVGRLVGGSLYKSRVKKDNTGKPKLDAQGKPIEDFGFGVAYPKNGATHFSQTPWGKLIWEEAHRAWPGGQPQRADFAWKITDGDSTIPNKANNKACDQEGYPGNYIIWFGGLFAPKTCDATGTPQSVLEYAAEAAAGKERILPGDFVQVAGSVVSNKSTQTAGMYMNCIMVAHSGYGQRIELRGAVDTTTLGFGTGPAPVGMSSVPLAAMPGSAPAATPAAPAVAVAQTPAVPIVPSTAFLDVPSVPVTPTMTGKAPGVTYQMFIDKGWTDEKMRAEGYIV